MSPAHPAAPWANAPSSIWLSRSRAPGVASAVSSAALTANRRSAVAVCRSGGMRGTSCALRAARATPAARPRGPSSSCCCAGESQGTWSCGAGVLSTTTRSTRSGRRAARAKATRPPADHPAMPAGPRLMRSSTAATSLAALSTLAQSVSWAGSDWPYPGRSTASKVTPRPCLLWVGIERPCTRGRVAQDHYPPRITVPLHPLDRRLRHGHLPLIF